MSKEKKQDTNIAKEPSQVERVLDNTAERYNELIMAVESKYPNESRHETALRYITEKERLIVHESGERI